MPYPICPACSAHFTNYLEPCIHSKNCKAQHNEEQACEYKNKASIVDIERRDNAEVNVPTAAESSDASKRTADSIIESQALREPVDQFRATWISMMHLLDQAKTPRSYQRKLVNLLNQNILIHTNPQGPFANKKFPSPDTYRRMIKKNADTTTK